MRRAPTRSIVGLVVVKVGGGGAGQGRREIVGSGEGGEDKQWAPLSVLADALGKRFYTK